MKKQFIMLIALLALVSLMITPACAETLTGELIADYSIPATYTEWVNSGSLSNLTYLRVMDIEKTYGWSVLVMFNNHASRDSFSTGDVGASTPVTMRLHDISGTVLGAGDIGYQRVFNTASPPVEQPGGFFYIDVISWDPVGLTGDEIVYLDYNRAAVNNFKTIYYTTNVCTDRSGMMYFDRSNNPTLGCNLGDYIYNRAGSAKSQYTVTKPDGIGIAGTLNKTGSDGVTYNTQGFIFGATGNVLSSQSGLSNASFYFTTNATQIKIGMFDSAGVFTNTSLLFTPGVPVPTVTPTPGPTVPPGYVRNNLYVWDQNDAQISGADVDVRDVEAGTWTNTTTDADGWITIDTLPYHTVNVYAHYPTAGIYLPNEILGLETGYYGGHNWVLVLYPYVSTPSGFVTLYINTRNYDTKAVLTGVNLQIKNLVTGATTGESTGSTDSVSTVVTNATNYQITGSKSGYISKTININSGEASSKTVVIELSKATVTPTVTGTPLPGEITARPTYAPGCDPAAYDAAVCTRGKDSDMMNQIRDAGPGLIALAIIATVVGLIKLMSKR